MLDHSATQAVQSEFTSDRNCYYQGTVVGDPNSWVALSTCHGLNGVIHAHGESFGITPDMQASSADANAELKPNSALRHMSRMSLSGAEQVEKMSHDHTVYRLKDYKPLATRCGVTDDDHQHYVQDQTLLRQAAAVKGDAANSHVESGQPLGAAGADHPPLAGPNAPLEPGSTPENRRFIELFVINDYERYQKLGENTEHETLNLGQKTDNDGDETAVSSSD